MQKAVMPNRRLVIALCYLTTDIYSRKTTLLDHQPLLRKGARERRPDSGKRWKLSLVFGLKLLGSLSARVFETRTATGREHFVS